MRRRPAREVSTGEGKSMLIAVLAVFLCLSARKRVHVVGSDAKLVQRDFDSFSGLFRAFAREVDPELPPERFAVLCGESQAPPASGGMHGGIWAPPRGGGPGKEHRVGPDSVAGGMSVRLQSSVV